MKMLYYDRIDVSEVIDDNKTFASKECTICRYQFFLDKGFNFKLSVCNGCHDILMMSMNLNDIAISNIHGVNYRCIINGISKSEAVNLLQNTNLSKKVDPYKILFFFVVHGR